MNVILIVKLLMTVVNAIVVMMDIIWIIINAYYVILLFVKLVQAQQQVA
jgi:hypothetical protein